MRGRPSAEDGQATVEFALVLPLVVLAASFVVATGAAVRDQLALVRAAGAAARAASLALRYSRPGTFAVRAALQSSAGAFGFTRTDFAGIPTLTW